MANRNATTYSRPQIKAPRRLSDYVIDSFGSLNTTDDPLLLQEDESPDALNVVYDTVHAIETRPGYTKVLTTSLSNPIKGIVAFYKSDLTKQLVYGSGSNLYRYNNAGGSVNLTGTPATFTANQQWSFDVYMDAVYGGNGIEPLIAHNGTAYSVVNAAINPQLVKVHKNRVFAVKKNSSTLYFSDAGNPSSFPVNNFIQINTNDGQNITGIEVLQDSLIIFKDDSIFVLDGEPLGAGNTTTIGNLQLRKANSDVGCTAFRTIQRVGSVLMFMHKSGLYVYQNYAAQLVSQKLNRTFMTGMNPNFLDQCWGVYSSIQKKYLLGFPSPASATPDTVIVYDLITKNYALWDNMPGACATNYRFSGIVDNVVMGDANKGIIYQLFQANYDIAGDNGTATGGSSTTLTDASKSWTTNALVDAKVRIMSGPGAGSVSTITANTGNTLTVSPAFSSAPGATSIYAIGGINSYWTTKVFDFGMPEMTKKYKYLNIFADTAAYLLSVGTSINQQPLSYTQTIDLTGGSFIWGSFVWGSPGLVWGGSSGTFRRANAAGQGRFFQARWGTQGSAQPWLVRSYSMTHKLKKNRADRAA